MTTPPHVCRKMHPCGCCCAFSLRARAGYRSYSNLHSKRTSFEPIYGYYIIEYSDNLELRSMYKIMDCILGCFSDMVKKISGIYFSQSE